MDNTINKCLVIEGKFEKKEPLFQRIKIQYVSMVYQFSCYLLKKKWIFSSMALGTWLIEPLQALKAGLYFILGWKKHFNFYSINPKDITSEQATKRPILLLHGTYHNQSAWLHLAKKLKEADLGPIYTVNLPHKYLSKVDYEIIKTKMDEIVSQYQCCGVSEVTIDVIGHSRGGIAATCLAWGNTKREFLPSGIVGKVITLGSALDSSSVHSIMQKDSSFIERIHEITAKYDTLVVQQSEESIKNRLRLDIAHLELLYARQAHEQIISWLKT